MKHYNDYAELLHSLIILNNYKNIIEIGVNSGDTTCTLCHAAQRTNGKVYGIDMWNQHGLFNQFAKSGDKNSVESRLNTLGYNNYELYKKNTFDSDFPEFLKSTVNGTYDLVFIDGCHSYIGCLNDFKAVYKNLDKAGTIVFHDTQRIDGCREFILDLRMKFNDGTFDIIDYRGGYGNREMGISILSKRQFPVLKIPINQLCGSPSTPKEIEEKEEMWYRNEVKKHIMYSNNISQEKVEDINLSEISDFRQNNRKYGK